MRMGETREGEGVSRVQNTRGKKRGAGVKKEGRYKKEDREEGRGRKEGTEEKGSGSEARKREGLKGR